MQLPFIWGSLHVRYVNVRVLYVCIVQWALKFMIFTFPIRYTILILPSAKGDLGALVVACKNLDSPVLMGLTAFANCPSIRRSLVQTFSWEICVWLCLTGCAILYVPFSNQSLFRTSSLLVGGSHLRLVPTIVSSRRQMAGKLPLKLSSKDLEQWN